MKPFPVSAAQALIALALSAASFRAAALEVVRFEPMPPAPLVVDVKDKRRSGESKTHNSGISGTLFQRHFGDDRFSPAPIELFRNRLALALGERLKDIPVAITELRITSELNSNAVTNPSGPEVRPAGASAGQAIIGNALGNAIVAGISEASYAKAAEEKPFRVYCVIDGNVGRYYFSGSASKTDPDGSKLEAELRSVVDRAIENAIQDLTRRLQLLSRPALQPAANPPADAKTTQ